MRLLIVLLAFSVILFVGCSEEETPLQNLTSSTLNLNISGLEDLGANARYEGWLIVPTTTNGVTVDRTVSTGLFTVNSSGGLSKTDFELDANDLSQATLFVLTIEPFPDSDPNPSDIHILAGDFSGNSSGLSVSHAAAFGNDFNSSAGKYIIATPTDGDNNNETSGIWFLDLSSGSPATGLQLPTLPNGWKYEGWAVINGSPVSTGTFLSASSSDDSAPFSGSIPNPPFPGEDFLQNAPTGLTFPTDLSGGLAVISIEPFPDNSSNPFLLKPLVGDIPANVQDHVTFNMNNNLSSFPTGTASR
jgi:hypothetical protein